MTSSSTKSPLKVGFVGLSTRGWAADNVGPALTHPSLRQLYTLHAIATTSEASAKASAAGWSTTIGSEVKVYSSASTLLEQSGDEIDVAAVAVKVMYHKEVLLPFIRAGKDFFVEWPVGRTSEETREIAAEAEKYGVRGLVGLQGRLSPVMRKVKEIIEAGKIGKVLSTNIISTLPREGGVLGPETKANLKYTLDPNNGISLISVPIAHQLDTVIHILGDFSSISATGVKHYSTSTIIDDETGKPTGETLPAHGFDHITLSGILSSNILATVTWRSGIKGSTPGRSPLFWEIDGEEGTIRIQNDNIMGGFTSVFEPKLWFNGEEVVVEGSEEALRNAIGRSWEEFSKGEDGQHATLDDAVKLKTLLDAISESIETGRQVNL